MSDDEIKSLREQRDELHFQLKLSYEDGESKLIPGIFRKPDDVHYGLDYFMSLDVYDMLCDIVTRLRLSAKDQLKIVLAAVNNLDGATNEECQAVRAEVIDRRDGSIVASSED